MSGEPSQLAALRICVRDARIAKWEVDGALAARRGDASQATLRTLSALARRARGLVGEVSEMLGTGSPQAREAAGYARQVDAYCEVAERLAAQKRAP